MKNIKKLNILKSISKLTLITAATIITSITLILPVNITNHNVTQVHAKELSFSQANFNDVSPSFWGYNEIMWARQNGIVSGFSDNTYKPNNTFTEAQFVSILSRYMNIEEDTSVINNHWSDRIYAEARKYNLPLKGYQDISIRNAPITRGNFARVLAFTQDQDSSLQGSIDWLYEANITAGTNSSHPSPYVRYGIDGELTRAQAAVFFYRLNQRGYKNLQIEKQESSIPTNKIHEPQPRFNLNSEMIFSPKESKEVLVKEMNKRGYIHLRSEDPDIKDINYTTIHAFEKGSKQVMLVLSLNGVGSYWINFSENDKDIIPITTLLYNQIDGLTVLESDLKREMDLFKEDPTNVHIVPNGEFYNTNFSVIPWSDEQFSLEIVR